jgi:hypothetical protein
MWDVHDIGERAIYLKLKMLENENQLKWFQIIAENSAKKCKTKFITINGYATSG